MDYQCQTLPGFLKVNSGVKMEFHQISKSKKDRNKNKTKHQRKKCKFNNLNMNNVDFQDLNDTLN